MVPFVHPSIPDKIRKQLIRDTFAERIKAYCEDKQQAKEHLSAITDEMIDEFEKYMEQLHPQEYRRLREAFGRITDDELGTSPLDSVVGAMKIAPLSLAPVRAEGENAEKGTAVLQIAARGCEGRSGCLCCLPERKQRVHPQSGSGLCREQDPSCHAL